MHCEKYKECGRKHKVTHMLTRMVAQEAKKSQRITTKAILISNSGANISRQTLHKAALHGNQPRRTQLF